jgi:hypothetical protein
MHRCRPNDGRERWKLVELEQVIADDQDAVHRHTPAPGSGGLRGSSRSPMSALARDRADDDEKPLPMDQGPVGSPPVQPSGSPAAKDCGAPVPRNCTPCVLVIGGVVLRSRHQRPAPASANTRSPRGSAPPSLPVGLLPQRDLLPAVPGEARVGDIETTAPRPASPGCLVHAQSEETVPQRVQHGGSTRERPPRRAMRRLKGSDRSRIQSGSAGSKVAI